MDIFPLPCLFPRAQLCYRVLSFRPSFVAPSLLMDLVPLPDSSHGPSSVAVSSYGPSSVAVSSHGSSFVAPSLPTDPAPRSRLLFQTHFRCRLFSRTQCRCSVSSYGPSSTVPSIFQIQFRCSVSFHGPSSGPRLIPSGPIGPSTVLPRYTNSSPTDKWALRAINTNVCLL